MATNEFEEPTIPRIVATQQVVHDLTGTDARLTLRLLVALLVVGLAGSTAPIPFNLVFAVALVVVVIEVARLAWKR